MYSVYYSFLCLVLMRLVTCNDLLFSIDKKTIFYNLKECLSCQTIKVMCFEQWMTSSERTRLFLFKKFFIILNKKYQFLKEVLC